MGRNAKKGLEYFPMDVDFAQDIKIRKLIKRQGGRSLAVYTLLLCIIYKDGYYSRWDEELPFIISEMSGFEEAYIREAISCCLSLGLLSESLFRTAGVLTSASIQERYKRICATSRRVCNIDEYCLLDDDGDATFYSGKKPVSSEEMPISSEEMPVSSEEMPISSEEMPISSAKKPISSEKLRLKKRKVKESKEKKRKGERVNACEDSHAENPARPEDFSDSTFYEPSMEEMTEYVGAPELARFRPGPNDLRDFLAYYRARGWRFQSGQPVADWRAALYSWLSRKLRYNAQADIASAGRPQRGRSSQTSSPGHSPTSAAADPSEVVRGKDLERLRERYAPDWLKTNNQPINQSTDQSTKTD